MKSHSEEICSKSTWPYYLSLERYSRIEVEKSNFRLLYCDCRSCPAIST